jgi:hypothetical protein
MLDALLKYVPKPLHPAYLGLLAQIPDYMTRIAVVGESCGAAGYLLKKRPGVTVTGVVSDPRLSLVAGQILDGVVTQEAELRALSPQGFEAVLLCNLEDSLDNAIHWLAGLAPGLREQGHVYALFAAPNFTAADAPDLATMERRVAGRLAELGYSIYLRWPLVESEPSDGLARAVLIAAVSPAYNPVLHARELREASLPSAAYHVLDSIPDTYLSALSTRKTVAMEKLITLRDWIRLASGHDTSILLTRAQDEFYRLTDEEPLAPAAYVTMADCWEASGDSDLACRLLRSIQYAAPSAELAALIARGEALEGGLEGGLGPEPTLPPPWNPRRPLRVLYLINPRPHYGLDVLFDGLCDCLGDGNVVDFPWKPTLHGGETQEHRHYPCRFNRQGIARSVEAICAELEAKSFDFILFGDVEGSIPAAEVGAILNARGDCPVFLMDAVDQMGNFRDRVLQRIGLPHFEGCFKREMHRAVDYGPNTWPMPFAYSGALGLQVPVEERAHEFFWAGQRFFGQRRLYVEMLERRFGWNLGVKYSQSEYQARIRTSRMGLNCFGMGFDTVRYWELPAQGCMLLSDRLPIHIPHNFEDGVQAVFFDDLGQLVDKLSYYCAHPGEAMGIAEAGRLHFQQYHTNEARAGQLLGRVQAVLAASGVG